MRNKIITLLAFALFCSLVVSAPLQAEEQQEIASVQPAEQVAEESKGIAELYDLAKVKDPILGRATARLEAGRADRAIAWAGVLPRINANASRRHFWHTVNNYSAGDFEGSYNGYVYGIGGQLPIFSMPAYFQIAAAHAGARGAKAAVEQAQQDLLVRMINDYVALLKARADEKLHRDELHRVSRILQQAEAFLQAGTGDIIAVYEAKARMDSAAADLIKTEAQCRIAEQALSSLTGIIVDKVQSLEITTPAGPAPDDLNWWLDTLQKKNPAIRKAKEELRSAVQNKRANWSGHLPTLQLQGGYTVDKGSTFLPEVETRQWYVGASVSLPIFSGGETAARTRRAAAAESEQRFMLDDTVDQGTRRLKEAFLNLRYNQSLAEAYQRKYDSARLQLKATVKGREIGTRNAIDLLNAEQTYAVAQRDLSNALYDNLVRQFELKAAAGILQEEDLQELAAPKAVKPDSLPGTSDS
ncbi:MAG: TolC family outer membrane protein [Desulfuromonadaceae bacterium]|nr:TolC family outer membrane protein [Desulfuromonadaceae bacterium]